MEQLQDFWRDSQNNILERRLTFDGKQKFEFILFVVQLFVDLADDVHNISSVGELINSF